MSTVFGPSLTDAVPHPWEAQLQAIEASLNQLDHAFGNGDPNLVAASAQGLHDALSSAMQAMRRAPRAPGMALPPALLTRLTLAQARARSHQQAVLRGRVAAERTLDVLLVRENADQTYSSLGGSPGSRVAAAYR